jgi:2,4-dienoyl-CoA reductase-like NADH-dependent reductase (Old Yellow Enzyme family)/thioredoxin reductase
MDSYPMLLGTAQWGPVPVRNRIYMPPMGLHMVAPDGGLSDQEIAYLATRAAGGAGTLITGCMVSQDAYEPPAESLVKVTSDDRIPKMRELADAVHARGAKIVAQMSPGFGRNAEPAPGVVPISASAIPQFYAPDVLCRPLEVEEIADIVRLYTASCVRCVEAGFDGIDIHAHTSYLLDQFMSPLYNHRTDAYGGSLENRMRFPVELIKSVRAAIGADHAISYRLTVDQKIPGGRTVDEARAMAKILVDAGIDVLSLDVGSYEAFEWISPAYYAGDDPNFDTFAAVGRGFGVPVAVTGNVTPEKAEQAIAAGVYQFMGSGRGLIADPDWPNKLAAGRAADVRPCIRCNEMCMGNVVANREVTCSVNPQAGRELVNTVEPAAQAKHLVVVGGGPAGLEAARVAALRGHRVDLYEKQDALGGVLEPAARAEFKNKLHGMVDWWTTQLDEVGVAVHLGAEVKADQAALADADEVLVATGSHPVMPPIPGLDLPHVVEVLDFHLGSEPAGTDVVVCGGGLSGCDAAVELARHGKRVTIVEMLGDVAANLTPSTRFMLLKELAALGIQVLTNTRVTSIDRAAVHVEGPDGPAALPADTVIAAFGVRSERTLADELVAAGVAPEKVAVIGDAGTPGKVGDAVHAGFAAARAL